MYFLIEDDNILKKYHAIWDKINTNIKMDLIANLYRISFVLKTKIEFHGDEATDFYHKEIPKVGHNQTCLAVITSDSALKKDENCQPKVFLKKCIEKEKSIFILLMT